MEKVRVNRVIMPDLVHETEPFQALKTVISDQDIPVYYVTEPAHWLPDQSSDYFWDILHPSSPYLQGTRCDLNNNSVVFRANFDDISLLFTGDLEQEGEARLLNQLTGSSTSDNKLNSQVLKVGHHGSSTATNREFLTAVSPKVAVISVGRGNPYGHPAPQLLARLGEEKVEVFRTDKHGAVIVKTDGNILKVQSMLPKDSKNRGR